MIVVFDDSVFLEEHVDDALLLAILRQGAQGRFAVKTRPAFHREHERPANSWVRQQRPNAAETALRGFERGLRWSSIQWPEGRREPEVIIEMREEPDWPTSFNLGPARLPPGDDVETFLNRPLTMLLEDNLSDMGFLNKTVPRKWRKRWDLTIRRHWLEPEHGGGITNMPRILKETVAHDVFRRLRMWALFDSDAERRGEPSAESNVMCEVCESIGVPFHRLERRMIENYTPEHAMRDWAKQVVSAMGDKRRAHVGAIKLDRLVDEYWALPPEERHYWNLKRLEEYVKPARQQGFKGAADVWCGDGTVEEPDILEDEWEHERKALFDSLFGSL